MQRTYFDTKLQKDLPLFLVVVLLAISVSLVAPAKTVYAENANSQEHSQSSAPTSENTSQSTQNAEASPSHGTKPSGDSQADNAAPLNGAAQTNANTESSAANQHNAQNGASSSLEKSGDPSQPSTSESSEASAPDSPKPTSGWEKCAEGFRYKDENGSYLKNCWFKDSDGWHFFNAAGIAARGWAYTTNNDIFYFDPSQEHHPALLGEVTLNGGRHYYFDESRGLVQDRWVKLPGGNWVYASKEGAFISGWHYIGNKIFYFDTEDPTHPALFGEVVLNGGRHYWFDENQGMASNQWVETKPGSKSFASKEGAFVSGWHYTTGGKLFYFDEEQPDHPVKLGEVALDGRYYWFDKTEGLARKQWVTLPNGDKAWATQEGSLTEKIINGKFFAADGSQPTGKVDLGDIVVYVSEDHKLLTGWQKIDGKDYFFNDDGRPASGWLNYGGSWYFLDSNGLMQTGWVHPSGSYWYHLAANGKMDTGWIKDGGKDYYLDPTSGAMKTGYLSWGGKLYHADSDGAMYEAPCYYPDMLRYAQNIYSATRWLIQIDTHQNRFAVYYGSYGNWVPWHEWYCTTGAPGMWTPHGQFTAGRKGLYFGSGYRCWYYTQISGEYLIHSILYNSDGYTVRDGRLGYHGSHGCVRLATENAKWVYNNIPYGTKIYIW